MYKHSRFVGFFLVLIFSAFTIHATLQSRTTHGTAWTGQVNLKSDIMRVTVMPFYLDIEEEVIIAPFSTSGLTPSGDQATMEIFGTFNLPSNAVIVSALLWLDDTTVLKAKLKPKSTAQSQYEAVVNRQPAVPPKAHDPIIIEQVGTDQYNLAVYPVSWTGERKIRIRYLTPQMFVNTEIKLPLTYVFGAQVQKLPNWFEINMKGGGAVTQVIYDNGQSITTVQLPSTFMRTYSALSMYLKTPALVQPVMAGTHFSSGIWNGDYLMLWIQVPDSIFIKSQSAGTLSSASVSIQNDRKSYSFSFPGTVGSSGITFQPLRFAAQSLATWHTQLVWTGYNAQGDVLATCTQTPRSMETAADTALVKMFAGSNVAYSEIYTKGGLGYLYGIVDLSYSLLALETDKVSTVLNTQLADSGAPYLLDSEIFKPAPVAVGAPLQKITAIDAISVVQKGRNTYRIQLGKNSNAFKIRITDSKGRVVAEWTKDQIAGKISIEWNGKNSFGERVGKGVYMINGIFKNKIISKVVIVL